MVERYLIRVYSLATGVPEAPPPPFVDKAVSGFFSKRKSRLGLTHVIERRRKA